LKCSFFFFFQNEKEAEEAAKLAAKEISEKIGDVLISFYLVFDILDGFFKLIN